MDPVQIKNALKDAGISQSDIARACRVTPGHVHRLILGMSISHPVQAVIAAAIERPVEEVFPKRYSSKRSVARIRELARVAEDARAAR